MYRPAKVQLHKFVLVENLIFSWFDYKRHVQGICDHVANKMKHMHGLDVDPITDIVICCGQTEAFAATMFASKV